jgi:hypothetical protein
MKVKLKHVYRTAVAIGEFIFALILLAILVYAAAAAWNGIHVREQQKIEQRKPNADAWLKEYKGQKEIKLEDTK